MKKTHAQIIYQTANKQNELIEFDKKVETNLKVLNRISTEESYQPEDIYVIAKYGIDWNGYNFDQQFRIIPEIRHLSTFLKQLLNENGDFIIATPIFIIYNNGNAEDGKWVTLCIIENQDTIIVLYKDSLGGKISSDVQLAFRTSFSKHKIDFKNHFAIEQKKVKNNGLMCLKNTEILIEGVKNNVIDFIINFEKITFCSEDELINDQEIFKIKLIKNNLLMVTKYLGKDEGFKNALKEVIDECIKCKEPNEVCQNYLQIFEEEIQKIDNDPNYCMNKTLIEEKKVALLRDPYIEKKLQCESKTENYTVKENEIVYKLNICEKFPIQSQIFSKVCCKQLMRNIKNKEIINSIELSSAYLGLDCDKFKQFFKINTKNEKITQNRNRIKPINIKDIIECQPKELSNIETRPLDQLLEECVLGMDPPSINLSPESDLKEIRDSQNYHRQQCKNNESILQLRERYEKVKKFYQKWSRSKIKDINKWAIQIKGKLKQEELYEAIAALNKANKLVEGVELRDTQILSLLIFLSSKEGHGQLCQIQTGEGKTTIVSLLATLKVLQGQQVDIITSNEILAAEGVKDRCNFYGVFGISVITNNISKSFSEEPRVCYTADVVYGCISNFQYDYLRHSFEGAQTRSNRGFEVVILDEVDSMLVDNGGYIAKLAEPFPGTYSLNYIYFKIWQELYKAEEELAKDLADKLQNKKEELQKENIKDEIKRQEYETYFTSQILEQLHVLKPKINLSNPANIDLIPHHLKNYADNMVDKWIDNAIYAKYQCKQNEQYIIVQKEGENVIVPVDYQNTGVTLTNTLWSNGLHQFLQLKHNLHITTETLTSSYISNIGYIKLYNNNIFGLTGTLGSTAEQELLSSIYKVNFAKVPTYRPRNFNEFEGFVVFDENWINVIALDSLMFAIQGRSVLIMCNTIRELQELSENIDILKKIEYLNEIKIKTILDENSSAIAGEEIGTCEIILATNIAGRGTDFKISSELDNKGGLHVCVTFLPVNKRVEDQAFGRTSRQGNSGTAQLIIKKSELANLDIDISGDKRQKISFCTIKNYRDQMEKHRLQDIKENKLKELIFKDAIFDKFSKLYVKFKEIKRDDPSKLYLIKDLKEYWSFWLQKQNFSIKDLDVSEKFQQFEKDARSILGNMKDGRYLGNQITFNPYYSIQQADYFLSDNRINDAENSLKHAINLHEDNSDLLYSVYMKLFDIAIEKGRSVLRRYEKCIKQLLGINLRKNVEVDELYKNHARDNLIKATKAFEKEINYINNNFFSKEINVKFSDILILPIENNHLLAQIKSRLVVLKLFFSIAEGLLEQIDKSFKNEKDVTITARVSENYLKVDNIDTLNQKDINSALGDLKMIGLSTVYELKEIHDVDEIVFTVAKCQIIAGISLLSCTAIFPPSAPFVGSVGCTLITEGIYEIFVKILNEENTEFNEFAYIKGKLLFYATLVLTMVIPTLLASTEILERVMRVSSNLASILKYSTNFISACNELVLNLDTQSKYNKKLKDITEYNQLSEQAKLEHLQNLQSTDEKRFKLLGGIDALMRLKLSKELGKLSKIQIFLTCNKKIKNAAILGAVGTVTTEKLLNKNFVKLLQKMKPEIKKQVSQIVDRPIYKNLLVQIVRGNFNAIVNKLIKDTHGRISSDALKKIVYEVLNNCNDWNVNIDNTVINSSIFNTQITKYTKVFCDKFIEEINTLKKFDDIQNSDEIINEMVNLIVNGLTGKICDEMIEIASTFGVNIDIQFKKFSMTIQENLQNISIIYQHYQTLGVEFGTSINNIKEVYTTESKTNPDDYVKYAKLKEACNSLIEFKSNISTDQRVLDTNEEMSCNNATCDHNNCENFIEKKEITEKSNITNSYELLKKTSTIFIHDEIRELYLHLFKTLEGGIFTQYKKHIRNYTLDGMYPSGIIPIKTDNSLKDILVNFHNVLITALEDYNHAQKRPMPRNHNNSENSFEPAFGDNEHKTKMMLGIIEVKFTDCSVLKRVTVSGDKKFFTKVRIAPIEGNYIMQYTAEPQNFDYQYNDYKFIDPGKPQGNIYDVYNHKEINMEYTNCCAAQKLLFELGMHMKSNSHLKIDGDILMAESWFKMKDIPLDVEQIRMEEPCKFCKEILPIITGLEKNN